MNISLRKQKINNLELIKYLQNCGIIKKKCNVINVFIVCFYNNIHCIVIDSFGDATNA